MFPFIATVPPLPPLPVVVAQPAKTKEAALLEKILRESEADSLEKVYGGCSYAWGQWKLDANQVRTTVRTCASVTERVAVSCDKLRINVEMGKKWGEWRRAEGKEMNAMASLCANVVPVPVPQSAAGEGALGK
jgi:hypothetical protein